MRQTPLTSFVNNAKTTLCMCNNDNAENNCGKPASNEVTYEAVRTYTITITFCVCQ